MLTPIPVTHSSLEDYMPFIGQEEIDEIKRLAQPFINTSVLHVNSTPFGGGVAELLSSLVPLMQRLGINAQWQVIKGSEEFFEVTKAMHNSLQGMSVQWTPEMFDIWRHFDRMNADLLEGDYDFVFIHDPQPAGILYYYLQKNQSANKTKWVWRCHIDLTASQAPVWDFLQPYVNTYDAAIFTMAEFVRKGLNHPKIFVFPPAIDPLSTKNSDLSEEAIASVLTRYGIDPSRPIISQTSRFDPWKDPLGVIDAYRQVKQKHPELQLVLVASMAHDDPEGRTYYERTISYAGEDPDIHLVTNLSDAGNLEVNAIQRASQVVIQKSLREGFGLSVSEALWKSRPVVAAGVGGIPLQVLHGRGGYLANTVSEVAQRVTYLLETPQVAQSMGLVGKEHIRKQFLITRLLKDYLNLMQNVVSVKGSTQLPHIATHSSRLL